MKETNSRSLVKTISWRIIATLTTAIVVLFFTGQWTIALAVGGVEGVSKLLFYYLHERAWNAISWGKKK